MSAEDQARKASGSVIAVIPPAERDRAYATMLLAFANDPFVRWMLDDPLTYATVWPPFCEAYAGRAFEHGTVVSLEAFAAVSMWLPPGVSSDDVGMERLLLGAVRGPALRDLDGVLEQVGEAHPSMPHWFLPLIGVDPVAQGRGLGTALLRNGLERCDRDGLPAYLEATSAGGRDLYARHGFEVLRVVQHGGSAPLWPMLRQPRPTA